MRKYEAVFILKADLKEDEINSLSGQITDAIAKNKGSVTLKEVWLSKKRLCFPIKKQREGTYFRVNFSLEPQAIDALRQNYQLNENILRVMITTDFLEGPLAKSKEEVFKK